MVSRKWPKLIKNFATGFRIIMFRLSDVVFRLKSKKFTADQDVVGSENGLIKMERFNGLEFDKQFALKFNEAFKDGIFGTVIITMKESGADAKLLTEFLLQKVNLNS